MNRKLQEPFTLGKHDSLQNEINEMMIAIKLHHIECKERYEKAEQFIINIRLIKLIFSNQVIF